MNINKEYNSRHFRRKTTKLQKPQYIRHTNHKRFHIHNILSKTHLRLQSSILYLITLLITLSRTPFINAAQLLDTSSATTEQNTISFYTNKQSFTYNFVDPFQINSDKQINSIQVSALGGISFFGAINDGDISNIPSDNTSPIENVIIAGALHNPKSIITQFSIKSQVATDATTLDAIADLTVSSNVNSQFPESVQITSGDLYRAYIFTFEYIETTNTNVFSQNTKFQIILAEDASNTKAVVILNIQEIGFDFQSDPSIFSGTFAYTRLTNSFVGSTFDIKRCQSNFDKSITSNIQILDVINGMPCYNLFESYCPTLASGTEIYTGIYQLTQTPETVAFSHMDFVYRLTCDETNNYGLVSDSTSLEIPYEDLLCMYNPDQYTYTWSADSSTCDIIYCNLPTAPGSSLLDASSDTTRNEGSTLSYVCPTRTAWSVSAVNSTLSTVCTKTGNNYAYSPVITDLCVEDVCSNIPTIPSGATIVSEPAGLHTYGSSITYKCQDNFKFAPNMVQNRLTIVCTVDSNQNLAYTTLSTTGCEQDVTSVQVAPQKDLLTNIKAKFNLDVLCDPNNSDGLITAFSNNFAALIFDMQTDPNSNLQDFQVENVVCNTDSQYEIAVTFNNVTDAGNTVSYNEKSDLANTYLKYFVDYIEDPVRNIPNLLAADLGATSNVFKVTEVSVTDPSDPNAETVTLNQAVMETKAELQSVVEETLPAVDASGNTAITFTDAIQKTTAVITQQFNEIVDQSLSNGGENSVAEKQAELDIANNMMETLSGVFDNWSSTTKELNATRDAFTAATDAAGIIVALVSKNTVSNVDALVGGENANQEVSVRPDVANNFLQSLKDMASFLVQSDPGMTESFSPFANTAQASLIDMKINILPEVANVKEKFGASKSNGNGNGNSGNGNGNNGNGNGNNRKKRSNTDDLVQSYLLNRRSTKSAFSKVFNRELTGDTSEVTPSAGTQNADVEIDVPESTLKKIQDQGLCGSEPFYKQRDNQKVKQTNYLNVDKSASQASTRKRRDSTVIDGVEVADRLTTQYIFTSRCYFTIPTDNQVYLEGPCISAQICGNRQISAKNVDEPIIFTFTGSYDNPRGLKAPEMKCGYWDEYSLSYKYDGVTTIETTYNSGDNTFTLKCQANHLTTFTVFFEEGYLQYVSPLWWYDLITHIFVTLVTLFVLGTYLGYWCKHEDTFVHYKASSLLYASLFLYLVTYLFGQFIGRGSFG